MRKNIRRKERLIEIIDLLKKVIPGALRQKNICVKLCYNLSWNAEKRTNNDAFENEVSQLSLH